MKKSPKITQPNSKKISSADPINDRLGLGPKPIFDNSDLSFRMVRFDMVVFDPAPDFAESNPQSFEESIHREDNTKRELKKNSFRNRLYTSRFSNIISKLTISIDASKWQLATTLFKIMFPHLLAILFSVLYIFMQDAFREMCFCMPNCQCSDGFGIRFYTIFRSLFVHWLNLVIMVNFFAQLVVYSIWVTFYVFSFCLLGGVCVYVLFDGNNCHSPNLEVGAVGISSFLIVNLYALIKEKTNLKVLLKKHYLQFVFVLWITLNRVFITNGLPIIFIKLNEFKIEQTNTDLEYLCFVIIYTITFKKLVFVWMFKFYKRIEEIKYEDLTPFIIMIRMYLCYLISVQTSDLISKKITDYSTWLSLTYYAIFQYCFYTHSYPGSRVFHWFLSKIMKKKSIPKPKDELETSYENLIAGYMAEFQLIIISRLLIQMYFKRWITVDFGILNRNCSLEINEKFWVMDENMVYCLIALNLALPFSLFLWIHHRKCNDFFDYKMEKKNVIFRALIIFGIHGFFEGRLQDYATMKALGKGFDICSQ